MGVTECNTSIDIKIMKRFVKHLVAVVALTALCLPTMAQTLSTLNTKKDDTGMSVRAKARFSGLNEADNDAVWTRIIYRQVDLNKEQNMPLYYPEEPIEGSENLFRLVLNLLCKNEMQAYEYLDGRELYTKEYALNLKDMLERFYIPYEEKNVRGSQLKSYLLEDVDIPSNEVLSYYVKEKWVFDHSRSLFFPTIEAICPVLHRSGDFGGDAVKYPMFWVRYADLRPYLMQQYIMTSSVNNTTSNTMDDFFSRRLFDGEIYKTGNLANKSLMQLYPSDSLMTAAQEKIERELAGFEENLWVGAPQAKKAEVATVAKEDEKETKDKEEDADEEEKTVDAEPRSSRGLFSKKEDSDSSSTSSSSSTKSSDTPKAAPTRSVRRSR